MDASRAILIPLEQLEPAALRSVVEEFVTRDGTELSDVDTKVAEVLALLRAGRAELWFDPETRSCNILPA